MINYLPGDVLVRSKFGFFDHFGIVIGHDRVLHNAPGKGEHISSIKEFSARQGIRVQPANVDRGTVLANARRIIGDLKEYDLINRNCEHTAYESIEGKARSPQLVAVLGFLLFVLLMWLVSRAK